jgi:hypothetical protein
MTPRPLSIEGIDLNEQFFIFNLADYIARKLKVDDSAESTKRLKDLPEHWRYIQPLIHYYNQVCNGGHDQYFMNTEGVFNDRISEGLAYFESSDFASVFAEALTLYDPQDYGGESLDVNEADGDDDEEPEDKFEELNSRFHEITPDLPEILSEAVRRNFNLYK